MSKVRVLAFVDNALGRDTEIILPIAFMLERYYQVEVYYKFIWDLLYIKLYKPDILLLPNTRGHHMYVEAARFAKKYGITVLALDSEGNFYTDGNYDIWGFNKERRIYQEWFTCWSNRTASFVRKRVSTQDQDKIIVTGGIAFDRYQFDKFKTKNNILEKYRKSRYQKIIGYAGWAFGKLHNSQRNSSFSRFKAKWPNHYLSWLESQRVFVRNALRHAIENNPDTLFILKKHPKEEFEDEPNEGKNEMSELLFFDNVLYIKNEEQIHDLISISDVWMGFETTTLFDAWILEKPTIVINQFCDFPRSTHYKGAIVANSGDQLDTLISSHYLNNNLRKFHTRDTISYRNQAIQNSIGFADGLNHVRTMKYFSKKITKSNKKKIPLVLRHLRLFVLMHFGQFLYNRKLFMHLPGMRKTLYVFENRALPGFEERKRSVFKNLSQFHGLLNLEKDLKQHNWHSMDELLHSKEIR